MNDSRFCYYCKITDEMLRNNEVLVPFPFGSMTLYRCSDCANKIYLSSMQQLQTTKPQKYYEHICKTTVE